MYQQDNTFAEVEESRALDTLNHLNERAEVIIRQLQAAVNRYHGQPDAATGTEPTTLKPSLMPHSQRLDRLDSALAEIGRLTDALSRIL